MRMMKTILSLCLTLVMAGQVVAQDVPPPSEKKVKYSPYPEQTFPNRVYFGDTHLHTSYSTDAGMAGPHRGANRFRDRLEAEETLVLSVTCLSFSSCTVRYANSSQACSPCLSGLHEVNHASLSSHSSDQRNPSDLYCCPRSSFGLLWFWTGEGSRRKPG